MHTCCTSFRFVLAWCQWFQTIVFRMICYLLAIGRGKPTITQVPGKERGVRLKINMSSYQYGNSLFNDKLVYFDGSPRTWNDIFYIETLHGVDLLGDGYNRSKIKHAKTARTAFVLIIIIFYRTSHPLVVNAGLPHYHLCSTEQPLLASHIVTQGSSVEYRHNHASYSPLLILIQTHLLLAHNCIYMMQ